jgi:hypothetical protein
MKSRFRFWYLIWINFERYWCIGYFHYYEESGCREFSIICRNFESFNTVNLNPEAYTE